MNKLSLVILIGLVGFGCGEAGKQVAGNTPTPPPYFVNATVQDNVYPGASKTVKLCVDLDTDKTNGCAYSDTATMSLSSSAFNVINIPSGVFYVYALKDVDSNGTFNGGDVYSATQEVTLNGNLVLSSPIILSTVL